MHAPPALRDLLPSGMLLCVMLTWRVLVACPSGAAKRCYMRKSEIRKFGYAKYNGGDAFTRESEGT
jgi:hypothetical protein